MRFVRKTPFVNATAREIDFEKLGYDTMLATRNREATEQICGLHLHAFSGELQPTITDLEEGISQTQIGARALHCDLYERDEPVRDARMFAHRIAVGILAALTAAAAIASMSSHIATFYLMGQYVIAWLMGPALTAFAVAAGYLAFEKLLSAHKLLQALVAGIAVLLAFWGLVQWAQARSMVVTHVESVNTAAPTSYVEGTVEPAEGRSPAKSDEGGIRESLRGAWIKFLLSADILVGILLGYFMKLRTDEDYVAWRRLKNLVEKMSEMELEENCLLSRIEVAKKVCMSGILRAMHTAKRKHMPYYRALPLGVFAALFMHMHADAQKITRQEGILIDVSGSIGSGNSNNELFREYLQAVKRHLEAEPPSSRVVVCAITTDSFGSVQELLKGWTPELHGIFTYELTRARRQLAASFAARSSTLAPLSPGTDIIGALWHLKTLMESGSKDDDHVTREIWIWSDMMNETATFNMPALLALGPDKMLEQAKANGLIVPLKGYKIHVCGASTRGLSPQTWNAVQRFWEEYLHDSGAELTSYSIDPLGG
jgi:hypothetical protein